MFENALTRIHVFGVALTVQLLLSKSLLDEIASNFNTTYTYYVWYMCLSQGILPLYYSISCPRLMKQIATSMAQ